MRAHPLAYFILFLALAIALGATMYSPPSLSALIVNPRTWFPVVDLHTNAYLMWRLDHLTQLVASLTSLRLIHFLTPLALTLFVFGSYRLARVLSFLGGTPSKSPLHSSIAAAGSALAALAAIGPDSLTLLSLAWLPMFVVLLHALRSVATAGLAKVAAPLWIISAFVSVELSLSANQQALLLSCMGALIAFKALKGTEDANGRDNQKGKHHEVLLNLSIFLVAFAPSLYAAFKAPAAPLPDYPPLAHVVSDDGIAGIVRPLIGADYPIQIVDRAAVKVIFAAPSLSLLTLSLALLVSTGLRISSITGRVLVGGLLCISLVTLDTLLPEKFAVIAPLMSISRLLPWGTSFSLTPLVLAIGVWLVVLSVGTSLASVSRLLITVVAAIGVGATTQSLWREVDPISLSRSPIVNDETTQAIASSPSAAVARLYSATIPDFIEQIKELRSLSSRPLRSLRLGEATIETSPSGNGRMIERLIDGSGHTRWHTDRRGQQGDEVMTIRFTSPTKVRALELDPGEYKTDFPRGLLIKGGSCDEGQARVLALFPSWQGALAFTPAGFPYFAGQNEVRIMFEREQSVDCLFVYQTSQSPFNWAVAELRIAP